MIPQYQVFPCKVRCTDQHSTEPPEDAVARWGRGGTVYTATGWSSCAADSLRVEGLGSVDARRFEIYDEKAEWDLWRERISCWVRAKQTLIVGRHIIIEARKKYITTSMRLMPNGVELEVLGKNAMWLPVTELEYCGPLRQDTSDYYKSDPRAGIY